MDLQTHTQAVMLLTTYLGKPQKGEARPLSPTEWGRFASWLNSKNLRPEDLLLDQASDVLRDWSDAKIPLERILDLLGRAGALSLALEKWERAGLWVMTRADDDYPARLKKRLKADSPPLFFGAGSRKLLNAGGVAIVGSRHISEDELSFARELGAECSRQGYAVVSGGARGVDEAAMLSACEQEGTVLGVLGDSLLRSAMSGKYRPALMQGNLVLISPFNPEAGFDVGNAMARNKYIYCLADAAVVVATDKGKGGTWSGALDNLKQQWVPLWVKPHSDATSGSSALVQRRPGARWLPEVPFDISSLTVPEAGSGESVATAQQSTLDLFSTHESESEPIERDEPASTTAIPATELPQEDESPKKPEPSGSADPREARADVAEASDDGLPGFYELFLQKVSRLTASSAQTEEQLLEALALNRHQLREWLKRALEEGQIRRSGKPAMFGPALKAEQASLFDGHEELLVMEQSA